MQRAGTVVAVTAEDADEDRVIDLMERYNPVDIDRRTESSTRAEFSGENREAVSGERSIPVIEEQLQVGKRAVQRGGVRAYRHTTVQSVEEQVHLREERVTVERRPANRPATEADMKPAGGD